MDPTRGLNRRRIAMVSIVVALPLIGVLLVGATEGADFPAGSTMIGTATSSAAHSQPACSASLRILRAPGEPPSSTSLRILNGLSQPVGLGQPGAALGDFADQAAPWSQGADIGPITNENGASQSDWDQLAPIPPEKLSLEDESGPLSRAVGDPRGRGKLEQPAAVRWAFASQPTAPPPGADAAPMARPSDAPWSDRERLVLTATEAPSIAEAEGLDPTIPQPLSQPLPQVPAESELPLAQSEPLVPPSSPLVPPSSPLVPPSSPLVPQSSPLLSKSGRLLPQSEPLPEIEHPLLGRPTTLPGIAGAAPMTDQTGVAVPDRHRLALAPAQGSSAENPESRGSASSSEEEAPETLGEAPEETKTELQFLRRDSVLLDPGEYQIDVTCQYLVDEADFVVAEIEDDVLRIGEARRRQRLLLVPLEFRLGVCQDTQVFVNVPFGWSNAELSFLGRDEYSNVGGIGDVSAGITRVLLERDEIFPDVLGTLAFSAPTGRADIITSLSTPGSSLGEGFWTLAMDLTFIHTYDPVVVFYGFGYRHRFPNEFEGGIEVNPGKQALYRLGLGFAVNPRVTLSASFYGSYIGDDRINDVRVAGGIREPMYLRFAATIVRDKDQCGTARSKRTVEPFFRIGMTDEASDALVGVSWTR